MYEKEIEEKIRELPDYLRKEVLNYIEYLLGKYVNKKGDRRKLKFDWEGGLSELKGEFSSVELQYKALEWR